MIYFLWLKRNLNNPKPHTCSCYLVIPANNMHGQVCNLTYTAYRRNWKTTITSHARDVSPLTHTFTHKPANIKLKNHQLHRSNHTDRYLYINRANEQKQQRKKTTETKSQDNKTSFYTVSEWEHFINVNAICASANTPLSMLFTMKRSVIQWMGFSRRILAKARIPVGLSTLVWDVDFLLLNRKLLTPCLTFHSSLEEHFAAATSKNPIMTPRGLVRADKTELGRWSRSCWGCGWRRAYIWSHSRATGKKRHRNTLN